MNLNFKIMMILAGFLLILLIVFVNKSIKEKQPAAGVPVSITAMFIKPMVTPIPTGTTFLFT
ncbi:hypothetical protein ACTXJ2_08485 [Psychrobacter alimentarius]|uniref:hypothetical protein n=1 Tax=Psychrobacter alimentarius TaxID=261164 RepID=UPI003FD59C69